MRDPNRKPRRPAAEHGAALIVGLVLLTVMTVLAVSTMSTANLELLMAGNTQYKENAFQLAESVTERAWRDYRLGLYQDSTGTETESFYRLIDTPGSELTEPVSGTAGNGDTYEFTVTALGSTNPWRCQSSTDFAEYHVQVEATAETAVRNARSHQRRGFAMCFLKPRTN